MKVLHIGKYYPPYPGGMESFLADLIKALGLRGIQSLALVHHHRPLWENFFSRGTEPDVVRVPSYGRFLYAPISPQFPLALARCLASFKPDVLHLHCPNVDAFWPLFLASARRLPWIVHWHSDVVPLVGEVALKGASLLYRCFEQALLRQARWVVATSPPYLETSRPLRPWRAKCRVIPLGVDPERLPLPPIDRLENARKIWGQASSLRLLCLGRLTLYKGHEILLEAVSRVPCATLLVVGSGPNENSLRRHVARSRAGHRIRLLGFRPDADVQALLSTAHVLCLPSIERTEAFGLVLLEAMRYGKVLVVSDIEGSGMTWLVHTYKVGCVVPAGNVDAWARTLLHIASHKEEIERTGAWAQEVFHRFFHIRKAAEAMDSLYRSCGVMELGAA